MSASGGTVFDTELAQKTSDIRLPTTRTEALLTAVIQEVLQVSNVDLIRHFVEFGSDSLTAARLIFRMSEVVGSNGVIYIRKSR